MSSQPDELTVQASSSSCSSSQLYHPPCPLPDITDHFTTCLVLYQTSDHFTTRLVLYQTSQTTLPPALSSTRHHRPLYHPPCPLSDITDHFTTRLVLYQTSQTTLPPALSSTRHHRPLYHPPCPLPDITDHRRHSLVVLTVQ